MNHAAVSGTYELVGHQTHRPSSAKVRAIGTLRSMISFDSAHIDARPGPGGERIKIVIFTAQTLIHGNMFACADERIYKNTWFDFLALCREHPEWDVFIKPHPSYDYGSFYETGPFAETPNIQYLPNATIDEAIEGADMALIMNIHTWVLPELISRGLPVIYVKNALEVGDVPQMEDGGTIVVEDPSDIPQTIERLAHDAPFRAAVLTGASEFLPRAVTASGTRAFKNLQEFVEEFSTNTASADPAARWVLNMIMLITALRNKGVTWTQFCLHLKKLKATGEKTNFDKIAMVDQSLVGPYILHYFMREPLVWPVNPTFPLQAAWQVYWTIPPSLRPDIGLLRSCGTLAFDRASAETNNPIAKSWYGLLGVLNAPGRIFSR